MDSYEQPPDNTIDQPPIAMDCGRHFIPASGLQVDLTCQECRFRAPGVAIEEPESEFWRESRLLGVSIIDLRQSIAEMPTIDFDSNGEELIRRDDVILLMADGRVPDAYSTAERLNKIRILELHLSAAVESERKLKIEQTDKGFTAIFWRGDGDTVETWRGDDPDFFHAIGKASNAYVVAKFTAELVKRRVADPDALIESVKAHLLANGSISE